MFCVNWPRSLRGSRLAVLTLVVALVATCACITSASAAVVVRDTWIDGTDDDPAFPVQSENGIDIDLDGDIESVWYQGGVGELNPVGPGGPLRGDFQDPTETSSASWTTYFTPETQEVNLAAPGNRMRVTWVFTPHNVNASNTSQNLRIALVDSPPLARIAANGSPGSAAYTGYGVFANMGETLGRNDAFELVERAVAGGALLSSSGAWTDVALAASDGGTGNPGYTDDTTYTFIMELTRNALNQIEISSSMTGGNLNGVGSLSASSIDVDPASFLFDTFAVRPSGATTTAEVFDTHLFRVDFIVPEPASIALLGSCGLALALMRRRKC